MVDRIEVLQHTIYRHSDSCEKYYFCVPVDYVLPNFQHSQNAKWLCWVHFLCRLTTYHCIFYKCDLLRRCSFTVKVTIVESVESEIQVAGIVVWVTHGLKKRQSRLRQQHLCIRFDSGTQMR